MVGAGEDLTTDIPEDWLRLLNEKYLTDEEKAQIEALGGFDKLMETLKERPGGAEGTPFGRLEMDRHGRNQSVRTRRL